MTQLFEIAIMCQGEQRRLSQLGYPKQLVTVGDAAGVPGKPILIRTLDQLRSMLGGQARIRVIGPPELGVALDHGADEVTTLANPGYCVLDGVTHVLAMPSLWPIVERANVEHQLRGVVLLGDVTWSTPALGALLADARDLVFAGTPNVSASEGEIFGLAFTPGTGLSELLATSPCRVSSNRTPHVYTKIMTGHLRRLLWWAMERKGLRAGDTRLTWHPDLFLPITDWTDDLDTPDDLARLAELHLHVLRDP